MAVLKNTTIDDTSALQLPVGTTAQRPVSDNGMIRYNSSFNVVEFWDGSRWKYLPDIVRESLVFYLDAGEPSSYNGSTLSDISGNNGTASLFGPTFSSLNGGTLIYNGINDYVNFSIQNLNNNVVTVEMWVKLGPDYADSADGGGMFFGWFGYDVWTNGGTIGFNTGSSDVYGISQSKVNELSLVNNWAQYVFVMRTDVSYTNNKIYINCINQQLSQQSSTETPARRSFNSGNGRIAGWLYDNNYRIQMSNAIFRVYNRELSLFEIEKNFGAQRARFGI